MKLITKLTGFALVSCICISSVQAALLLDRTRIIYNEGEQSVSLGVTNQSKIEPYIAQSWIEDSTGHKVKSPFLILPPLARIEANEKTMLRVTLLPGNTLPADKESVFYVNVTEIPPKSNKVNALQIALRSRIKMFYRPAAIAPKRDDNLASHLTIITQNNSLSITNPTPLHITLVSITEGSANKPVKFDPVMMSPGQSILVPYSGSSNEQIVVSHMNDYGGEQMTKFDCSAGSCKAQGAKKPE